MPGQDQSTDADEHYHGRMEDTVLVGGQTFLPVGVFIDKAFGDKDRVVVPLAEDERGENDVDDVEADVQQPHKAQNPEPADNQWKEGQEPQFKAAEAEGQEHEHHKAAYRSDVVKAIRQDAHETVADVAGVEDKRSVRAQGFLYVTAPGCILETHLIDNQVFPVVIKNICTLKRINQRRLIGGSD